MVANVLEQSEIGVSKTAASSNAPWTIAEAPSNIALIKYMGKIPGAAKTSNTATNSSVSWTLDHLKTRVRIRWEKKLPDAYVWRPLVADGFHPPELSEKGRERFLAHAERCVKAFGLTAKESLVVESANGFPSDCGLASSASSFAALTMAVAKLSGRDVANDLEFSRFAADVSRQGSGSSCRSFFSPWCAWTVAGAEPVVGLPEAEKIRHLAVIVDETKKMVSSSEAHLRVATSALFDGRVARAEARFQRLIELLRDSQSDSGFASVAAWNEAADLVWAESWDMHALFETSKPPFGYFTENSVRVLNAIREVSVELGGRKPMVTMDAGPNVHVLLWRDEFLDETVRVLKARFGPQVKVIDSDDF